MRYLEGVSLAAFARGNRRMLAPLARRHRGARDEHAEQLAAWKEQRGAARAIKDPDARAAALDALKSERPTHPAAIAAGVGAGGLFLAWPAIGPAVPTVLGGGAALWLVAALAAGQEDPGEEQDDTLADEEVLRDTPADEDDEIQEAPADAVLYALIRHIAGLSDQGTAAHLQHVIEEGERRGLLGGWEVSDLREHLDSLGVGVVKGKKLTFKGRPSNRMAVLVEALPEASPAPVPAVRPGAL